MILKIKINVDYRLIKTNNMKLDNSNIDYVFIFFCFKDSDGELKVALCKDKVTKKWSIPGGKIDYCRMKTDNPIFEQGKKYFTSRVAIMTGLEKQNKLSIRFPHYKITATCDNFIDGKKIRTYYVISLENILMKPLVRHNSITKVKFELLNLFIYGKYRNMSYIYSQLLKDINNLDSISWMEKDIYHKCSYLHNMKEQSWKKKQHIEEQYKKIEEKYNKPIEVYVDLVGEDI